MSTTLRRVLAVTSIGALLAGCTPVVDDRPDGADAVVSPLPSPVAASDEPSPVATPEPSPSPTAALEEEEALAAARARRAERADCDPGFADETHEVVATTGDGMLVFVVCFVGAYQPSGELQLWDGASLQPLAVEQWQFGDVLEAPEVVGLVSASSDGATPPDNAKFCPGDDVTREQLAAFLKRTGLLTG